MERDRSRPNGLTLVELLVALAILAALIGLLLGAVQKARDRAANLAAANAARQVVLAAHNYSSSREGRLPNIDGNRPNLGLGALLALNPDLGQQSNNDPPSPLLRPRFDPTFRESHVSDLYAVFGRPATVVPDTAVSFAVNPFVFAVGAKLDTVAPDGLSHTVAATTHYANCTGTAFESSLVDSHCIEGPQGLPCTQPPSHRATFADALHFDVLPVTTVVNGIATTVGSQPRTFQHRPAVGACDYRVPQSLTSGGLTVGMADGSVRTVRPQVAPAVFWGAVTPNGSEVLAWDD